MSTHIGPAFKLKPDTDLLTFSERLRSVVQPALKLTFFQHLHDMAVISYDLAKEYKPFPEVIKDEVNEYCHCSTKDRPWVTDQLATLTAYLYRDSDNDLFLVIQNAPTGVAEAVEQMDEVVEEFSYHNSSDSQLSYLTEEEWEARKNKWDELLGTQGRLTASGVSIHLGIEPYALKVEDYEAVRDQLTTDEDDYRKDRIRKNVYSRLITETCQTSEDKDRIFKAVIASVTGGNKELVLTDEFPTQVEQSSQLTENIWEQRGNLT